MTIIGIEIRTDNKVNLLVLDPMFKTSPAIERLIGRTLSKDFSERSLRNFMKPYRRGDGYLKSYNMFETLM